MPEFKFRIIAFQEGDWWVAQCLERDIATNARKLGDLWYEIEKALVGQVMVNEGAKDAFEGIPRAPQRYWDMWEEAQTILSASEKVAHFPIPEGTRVHPEYELRAA